MKVLPLIVALTIPLVAQADLRKHVGSSDFSDWSGISTSTESSAVIQSGQSISYTYADQNRIYPGLMRDFYGDSADWYDYAGIAFEIYLEKESSAQLSVAMKVDPQDFTNLNPVSTATLQINGQGWQQVYIPWNLFDIDEGQRGST
ncbi:MAG: hypothetical protein ABF330_00875, partial [Lentimonas sp.]